ncbi:MAG: leucine-rich repeat protein [Clostridia bacterium]|nr:leucine-rich repeat protein [Clostridia bacterium]
MKEQKTTLIIVITAIFVFIGIISALTFEIVGLLPDIPTKGSEQSIIQNDENKNVIAVNGFLMPDIAGKSIKEAEAEISKCGLVSPEKRYVFSDTVSDGVVISQSVEAGQKITNDAAVVLYVSLGKLSGLKQYSKTGNTVTINRWDTEASGEVIVPYEIDGCTVTKIAKNAFKDCYKITSVILPDGIDTIENYAFWLCKGLEKINIPKNVTEIAVNTFTQCAFTEIILPEGILTVRNSAYADCFDVRKIQLPNTLTRIEEHAFSYCRKITEITIPDSVDYIHENSFPDTVKTVYFQSVETKQRFSHLFSGAVIIVI